MGPRHRARACRDAGRPFGGGRRCPPVLMASTGLCAARLQQAAMCHQARSLRHSQAGSRRGRLSPPVSLGTEVDGCQSQMYEVGVPEVPHHGRSTLGHVSLFHVLGSWLPASSAVLYEYLHACLSGCAVLGRLCSPTCAAAISASDRAIPATQYARSLSEIGAVLPARQSSSAPARSALS